MPAKMIPFSFSGIKLFILAYKRSTAETNVLILLTNSSHKNSQTKGLSDLSKSASPPVATLSGTPPVVAPGCHMGNK